MKKICHIFGRRFWHKIFYEGGFRGIGITDHAFKITKITKSRENNAIFTITQNYCESRNHGKIHKISRFTKIDLGIFTAAIRLFSFQIPTFTDFPDQIWSNSLTEFQKTNGKIQIKRETQLIMCAPFLTIPLKSWAPKARAKIFLYAESCKNKTIFDALGGIWIIANVSHLKRPFWFSKGFGGPPLENFEYLII